MKITTQVLPDSGKMGRPSTYSNGNSIRTLLLFDIITYFFNGCPYIVLHGLARGRAGKRRIVAKTGQWATRKVISLLLVGTRPKLAAAVAVISMLIVSSADGVL